MSASVAEASIELLRMLVEARQGHFEKPYKHQEEMFKAFEELAHGDLDAVILKAPCGAGKTEAIAVPYLAQYVINKVLIPRIVYATPTQTLLYNMRKRFTGYLELLKKRGVLSENVARWLEPEPEHGLEPHSRYLVPRFTVATYDVVAYAWMSRRTIPWRPFTTRGALLSSLVVFDEAHLMQDLYSYTQHVFTELVASMARAGVPLVIMSATLPKQLESWLRERLGIKARVIEQKSVAGGIVGTQLVEYGDRIELDRALQTIREYVLRAVRERRDVLVVVNTVRVAHRVYEGLRRELEERFKIVEVRSSDEVVKYLSSGEDVVVLCFVHGRLPIGVRRLREEVFEVLREERRCIEFEGREKRWSLVVVATQVAEVGLDYSFDVVVTEVAPPSALVQRALRSGRIPNQRSEVYVLPPIMLDKDALAYQIYGKELLSLGTELVQRRPSGENLRDLSFVTEWVTKEFSKIEEMRSSDERLRWLLERALEGVRVSLYLPPLATAVHRRVVERFRLRLGEYIAVYPLKSDVPSHAGSVEEVKRVLIEELKQLDEENIVSRCVRLSVRVRRREREGKTCYAVEVPRSCVVWLSEDRGYIVYVDSLKSLQTGELKIEHIELTKRGNTIVARDSLTAIYGRIVFAWLPDFNEERGLIEVDRVEILTQ